MIRLLAKHVDVDDPEQVKQFIANTRARRICYRHLGTEGSWAPIQTFVYVINRDNNPNELSENDIVVVCGFPDDFSGWGTRR